MFANLENLDRIAGRLVFRFFGGMCAVVTLGLIISGAELIWTGSDSGARLSAILVLALAALIGRFTVWCFAPDRRLSLMDPV